MNKISTFNTGETQMELKNKYNPEGSILRKAQYRMLDMLIYFDNVCNKAGIPYSLSAGNVLGAIRHGGFIPWDDDVDVVVKRKDFKRLNHYLEKHPHPQYVVQNHHTDSGYMGCWSVLRDIKSEYFQDSPIHNIRKYRGLQIDILPLDKGMTKTLHHFCRKLCLFLIDKNIKNKNIKMAKFGFNLTFKCIFPIILLFCKVFGNRNILMYPIGSPWGWQFQKSWFNPLSKIEFEGHHFNCVNHVEDFLSEHYGNYMDLPPLDKRKKHKATYKIWD